jgi:predicted nucleotide-binding protein
MSLKERLELYEDVTQAPLPKAARSIISATGKTVFIVHGRADAPKQSVARFLEQVGDVQPIILHEQPSGGLTIIEKFEDYAASAAFAVMLLTLGFALHAAVVGQAAWAWRISAGVGASR